MDELERIVAIIKPTEKCLDWLNSLPDTKPEDILSLEDIRADSTAILLPEFKRSAEAKEYIRNNYIKLFDHELETWETDKSLWPKTRSFETFLDWFDIEFHTMVYNAEQK